MHELWLENLHPIDQNLCSKPNLMVINLLKAKVPCPSLDIVNSELKPKGKNWWHLQSSPCKVQQFNWIICLKEISGTGDGDTFDSTTIFDSDSPTTNPQFRYLFLVEHRQVRAICTVHISLWKTGIHWYYWNRWTSEQLEPTTGSRINTQWLHLNVADPSNVEPWEILRAWDFRMFFWFGGKVDQKLEIISLNWP